MKDVIEKFYTAFNNLDARSMTSCYHKDIVFKDPAFGELHGADAKMMWHMLCESQQGKNFKIKFSDINIKDGYATAYWEAFYIFSKTGRKVHNKIRARFEFSEGLITRHEDNFNLYQWAKQALGFKGYILGHTTFFKQQLQKQTRKTLAFYKDKKKRPK